MSYDYSNTEYSDCLLSSSVYDQTQDLSITHLLILSLNQFIDSSLVISLGKPIISCLKRVPEMNLICNRQE